MFEKIKKRIKDTFFISDEELEKSRNEAINEIVESNISEDGKILLLEGLFHNSEPSCYDCVRFMCCKEAERHRSMCEYCPYYEKYDEYDNSFSSYDYDSFDPFRDY